MHHQESAKNFSTDENAFVLDLSQDPKYHSHEKLPSKSLNNKSSFPYKNSQESSSANRHEELERLYQSDLLIEKAKQKADQIPIMMSFEVETALEASEELSEFIEGKVKEREKRLNEFEGVCYKVFTLVFSMLGGVLALTILFNLVMRQRVENLSHTFIDLVFNIAQCCIFYIAYKSVVLKNVEAAKKVVLYLKFFTVFYAIVYMTIACARTRETLEKNDGLASYFQERAPFAFDLQIAGVVINTIIYLVIFDRSIKIHKLLSELCIYQYKLFGYA